MFANGGNGANGANGTNGGANSANGAKRAAMWRYSDCGLSQFAPRIIALEGYPLPGHLAICTGKITTAFTKLPTYLPRSFTNMISHL